jgi:hypothetical protein
MQFTAAGAWPERGAHRHVDVVSEHFRDALLLFSLPPVG